MSSAAHPEPAPATAVPRPGARVVARGAALGYGRGAVLEGLELDLAGGTIVGLLGPNGGGKSTLVRALTGQLRPLAGTLEVGARPALVPQTERSRLDFPVTALDVVVLGALPRLPWWRRPGRAERRRGVEELARLGLGDAARTPYGSLSGGQRQRVLVARALLQDAPIVVLDEPFTGLDVGSAARLEALLGELAAEGRLVVVATHDLDQARRLHRVLCLNGRQVALGAPDAVLDRATLEATFGGAIAEVPGAGPGAPARGVLPAHHCHDEPADRR